MSRTTPLSVNCSLVPFTARSLGFALLAGLAAPLHAQESLAHFDAPLVVNSEFAPAFRQLLDFNGDGRVDALGYDREDSGNGFWVTAYRGNGAGALTSIWSERYTAVRTTDPRSAIGSFGAPDALDDFVVSVGETVRVYRAAPDVSHPFGLFFSVAAPGDVLDVAAGDFDGDGFGDFALLLADRLQCYCSEPGGALVEGTSWPLSAEFDRVEVFSFNGDARPSLFLVGPHALTFRSLRGGFQEKARRPELERNLAHGCMMPMAAVGDVDGDGDDDVALFEMSGEYRVLRQGPNGGLQLESARTGGPATNLADVDGDGDLDGVCCGGGSSVFNRNPTFFEIALNDGRGNFLPSFQIPGLGAQHIAGVADLDGDGDVELIAGRVIYYSRGGVHPPIPTSFDDDRVAERALADIDADGDLDYGVGLGTFRRNLGDGTSVEAVLAAPATNEAPGYVGPGYPGDFDGDGIVDLLVELWNGNTFEGLHLLHNAGGSHLEDAGLVALPSPAFSQRTTLDPRSSLVADLDNDGKLDLVVRDPLSDDALAHRALTWVWFNDLPAGFTQGPRFDGQQVMAVGDLNGDGWKDLVVTALWNGNPHLWWRPGIGARDFGSAVRLLITNLANGYMDYARDSVGLGHLPGDVGLEPVFVYDVHGIVEASLYHSVYNPGTNAFTSMPLAPPFYERIAPIFFTTEWENRPNHVFCPDLNASGTSDLVYGNLETAYNGVVYWLRDPAGDYRSKTIQLFRPLAFADVDGDGDPDAIGARLIRSEFIPLERGGSRLQYGQGAAGSGGYVPQLGASGPFVPGRPMTWRISGARPGAQGMLVFGSTPRELADAPVAGVTSYVDPAGSYYGTFPLQLGGTSGDAGAGFVSIPLAPPLDHAGTTEYLQAFIVDPKTPGGLSATNALRIRWAD